MIIFKTAKNKAFTLNLTKDDGVAGTWYCMGSSGRNYTGTFSTAAAGCYYNP